MEICLFLRRSYLLIRILIFKQQGMESLSMVKKSWYPKTITCTHPTSTLNSYVRCDSILFKFLKQSNKIFASTTSKMPNNAFHFSPLWREELWEKLSILTKLLKEVLCPSNSQRKLEIRDSSLFSTSKPVFQTTFFLSNIRN